MRAILVAVIAVLLAIVVRPPIAESSVLLGALHDAGHVIAFSLIAFALCVILRPASWRWVVILAVLAALAVGTEWAQRWLGGAFSLGDVGRDLLGAAIGVSAWIAARRRRPILFAAAAIAMVAGLVPLGFTGWAYTQRAAEPDLVWDASRATHRVFIEPPRNGSFVRPDGASYARFTSASDTYAGIVIREPTPDWREYGALVVRLSNPGDAAVTMNVRVDDRPADTEYEDRFNRARFVPAHTEVQWRIPLHEIEHGPVGRRLDLSHITKVVIFLSPPARGASFDLRDVRLDRRP